MFYYLSFKNRKGRCDFLDGVCHESPRWVSLLVAEVFYPQPKYPNLISSASEMKATHNINPFQSNLNAMNSNHQHLNGIPAHYHQLNPYSMVNRPSSPVSGIAPNDYYSPDHYLHRKMGLAKEEVNSMAKPRFVDRT